MEYAKVVDSRHSCRGFTNDPVTQQQVEQIAALAAKAPSWGNTQPWKLYAVGGGKAKEIRRRLVEAMISERPQEPDLIMPMAFAEGMSSRYKDLGRALFKVLGIAREDADKRSAHYANNFSAFGAPCLLFVTVPKDQTSYAVFDAGAFAHGLCLAAASLGLGTVILAALARFPEEVRAVAPIPEEEDLVIGVALGHPDPEAPANGFRSVRQPLEEMLTTFDL
ncbi:MAG: nitroreductase [Desulfarculaceae bacterium]|nr:nitroreductase [Desulfarculaceae bacterium]MCF8049586.1 nitroreductase [Desulfarculaceae bacterium]MCF8063912.1 nitroreductase [Desulfarculaceae bacterium]MCF8097118.1 nitroreductase [Desulfarculaceae bacterium]MCF8122695.1 nitroreductase [Desulfarculaceae bacterium]